MENNNHLANIRHTLAHLLAQAVKEHYKNADLTLGPSIDNGFYYDIDFKDNKINDEDLEKIEKTMKKNLLTWEEFTHKEVSLEEAEDIFKENKYKLELISEINQKGEKITLYTCGGFTDLCRGGHIEKPNKGINPNSFILSRVAGAYWRGDEKNKMLTRIYGLAFNTKEELDTYIWQQEEAKKRDHRKIGKELGLFIFSDLVGPGLPLWTPKGTLLRDMLDEYVWSLRKQYGYQKVCIPHITKKSLYETSGHWDKYSDDLFKIETREKHLFAMKPMNCPHHTQIFDSEVRSYRDMPQRYAETTMVYRDEQSGELSGLSRVISITQDDAHVFCREIQIEEEVLKIWSIVEEFYGSFGFELKIRFSRHDENQMDKYLGKKEIWEKAEKSLQNIMEQKNIKWIDGVGEAAFYGPKIDFISHDSIGRVLQVATIQLDFNQPKNFGLVCTNEKGEKEEVVMIHCAIMGSIERFISTLIEHLAGNFPLWLSPVQVIVLPISEHQKEYANKIFELLKEKNIRVKLDDSNESLGKRIRNAKIQKIPYLIVIGDKERDLNTITVEGRTLARNASHSDAGGEKLENITIENFIEKLENEIINKI